jgi:molecular chaperone GrpE
MTVSSADDPQPAQAGAERAERADVALLELPDALATALAEAEALAQQVETRAAVARLTGGATRTSGGGPRLPVGTVNDEAAGDGVGEGEDDDGEDAYVEVGPATEGVRARVRPGAATTPRVADGPSFGPAIRGIPAQDGATVALRTQLESLRTRLEAAESAQARAVRDAETARADLKATRGRFQRAADQQVELQRRLDRAESELPARTTRNLLLQLLPALDAQHTVFRGLDRQGDLPVEVTRALEMVRGDWERVLAGLGVRAFDAEGERFDPAVHEAISTVQTADAPVGTVLRQVGRGYLYEGRLLRSAQVVVAAAVDDDVG